MQSGSQSESGRKTGEEAVQSQVATTRTGRNASQPACTHASCKRQATRPKNTAEMSVPCGRSPRQWRQPDTSAAGSAHGWVGEPRTRWAWRESDAQGTEQSGQGALNGKRYQRCSDVRRCLNRMHKKATTNKVTFCSTPRVLLCSRIFLPMSTSVAASCTRKGQRKGVTSDDQAT